MSQAQFTYKKNTKNSDKNRNKIIRASLRPSFDKRAASRFNPDASTNKNNNDTLKTSLFHTLKFQRRLHEGVFIITIAFSAFLLLALETYRATDPSWSYIGSSTKTLNAAGPVGAWAADILLSAFGYVAYIFPLLISYAAWMLWQQRFADADGKTLFLWRTLGFCLLMLASTTLLELHFIGATLPFGAGGVLGNVMHPSAVKVFSDLGANLVLIASLLIGITLFTGLSWIKVARFTGRHLLKGIELIGTFALYVKERWLDAHLTRTESEDTHIDSSERSPAVNATTNIVARPSSTYLKTPRFSEPDEAEDKPVFSTTAKKAIDIVKPQPIKNSARLIKAKQMPLFPGDDEVEGSFPSLLLLDAPEKSTGGSYTEEELEDKSRLVETKLKDFGVDARVVAVHPGPVVTRFELDLAAGTKVSRITGLAKDLARSLSVISVRVVEVIPGKSVIGLELPNSKREIVRLREILAAQQYESTRANLALALGKDISGQPIVVDLARMPHLLVAGTTGAGKSVCLNALLLSLLYKYTPAELRLIMIDPKMLELSVYEGIPHLLVPVVTNMKEAANALRWCVGEMERRYKLMMSLGVRNIAGCNHKIKEARSKGKPILDPLWQPDPDANPHFNARAREDEDGNYDEAIPAGPPELEELPYIVVIADEYADMIMVVGKRVEELIARIAQKARAAGIHLVLATQRPSVDVITGLIKANIPSRIAFQVSSKIDSRTILDQSGAEQLLGHGDMLYLPPGSGIPVRVHGAFVADEEVHRVVQDWQRRGKPDYVDAILEGGSSGAFSGVGGGGNGGNGGGGISGSFGGGYDDAGSGMDGDSEQDELYDQAVQFITQSRRASVSSVQRRFKIGYNRAARIVDAMEAAGVVGPMESNGNRAVLAPAPPQR